MDRGTICVFAKPPRPGRAKTRLASAVGEEGAARLARAFLEDTWDTVSGLPWANAVLASTEADRDALGLDEDTPLWLQGEGDLGQRMERVLARALRDAPWAMALGADSPGLPPGVLERARDALAASDAVLGPMAWGREG